MISLDAAFSVFNDFSGFFVRFTNDTIGVQFSLKLFGDFCRAGVEGYMDEEIQ